MWGGGLGVWFFFPLSPFPQNGEGKRQAWGAAAPAVAISPPRRLIEQGGFGRSDNGGPVRRGGGSSAAERRGTEG